jgi:CRISPR/Cas system CSM-associated protein Csm5 (group 7 of RAMP superfamily)
MTQHLVEILTPLHIGTGNSLKYDYDYLIENGKVLVVDQHSLLQQLMTQDFETLKELTAEITKLSELKPILRTLEQGAGYQLAPFSKASSLPKGQEIRAQIKDAFFRPYLPGSSIKGAIRTALLAEMIKEKGLAAIKGFLPKEIQDKNGNKKASLPAKYAASTLVNYLFAGEGVPSGKVPNFDFLRAFQISDAFFETHQLGITDVRWLNIDNRGDSPKPKWKNMSNRKNEAFKDWQQASGIFVESLLPATTGLLTWQVDEFLLNDKKAQQVLKWQNLPDFSTFKKLRDLLNAHAKERLLAEKAFFDDYGVREASVQCQKLLQHLGEESEACYLQVGWGNGWHGMTGDWMDEETKNDMRNLYNLGKKGIAIFPKTRRLIVNEGSPCLPLGWLRIWSSEDSKQQLLEQEENRQRQALIAKKQASEQEEIAQQRALEAALPVEEKALRDLQQAFEQAKATQEKAGGPLSTLLNSFLSVAETWPLSYRQQLADKTEEIYQSLEWWGNSKKKQEKKEKIAKLRQSR